MEKFKDKVFRFANFDPNNPLLPSQLALIHHQLNLAFPDFRTPTHPTYSSMIQNAIEKLNEEDGSKEELISEYIKEEYKGLPWAHDMYLSHHLTKLCENGEILYNSTSKCYTMPMPDWARSQDDNSKKKGRKRRLVRKRKESVTEDKEGNIGGEKLVEESGDMIAFQEEGIEEVERLEDEEGNVSGSFGVETSGFQEEDFEEFGRNKKNPGRRSLVFIEECDEVGSTAVDAGGQNAVVWRPNEKLAREGGDGDINDAANLMRETAECVEEAPINLISSSVANILGENDCDLAVDTIQAGIQEGNLRMKRLKEEVERKSKGLVNENAEGDLGGEIVVDVCNNQIEFQKENIEECGKSMAKPRGLSLVVIEDNDEVGRTAFDGEEQNLVVESYNEVSALGDTSDTDKMILVPSECVEGSPLTLISSSVTNIRCDNVPKPSVNKSALMEREFVILPYKGNTSVFEVSAEINPIPDTKDEMIVCALPSVTEQIRPMRKKFQMNRLIAFQKKRLQKQRKLKVSLETMPSLLALAADLNLLENEQLQELLHRRAIELKVSEMESERGPIWLERMLKEQYFIPCSVHADSSRNSCNRFCIDCMGDAFCLNCLPHHKDHHVVQIRAYSCHTVVKTHDLQQHLDISNILTHNIECGNILCIDVGPQPRSSKGVICCEICCSGRIDSFRFCSLHCKLIAARLKSTMFLPINQSRQASSLCLLEGTSIEQLDTQKSFNPSQLSRPEDPMSVEDEENIPLQMVLRKCGKRKKQMGQKFTSNTPLVTETTDLIGSNSSLDLPISECSNHQMNDKDRQGQMDVKIGDVEASISPFVEGDLLNSYQKCEQEPKQSEATKDDAVHADDILDLHLQLPEGLDKPVTNLHCQKQTKQLNMDGQGKSTEKTETGKKDVAGSSNLDACEQEGMFEPATNQHSQQQIKPEEDARVRPLKYLEAAKNDTRITLDLHHPQQAGSSEPDTVGAAKNDATITSVLLRLQLAGSSEPETAVQVRKQEKRGPGRPRKRIRLTKEGLESEETNKKPKNVGRGRSRKQQDVNEEDSSALLVPEEDARGRPLKHLEAPKNDAITSDLHHQQQARPSEPETGGTAKNDATITSDLPCQQSAGLSEPETAVQVRKQEKRGRGRPSKHTRVTKEGQESEETNKKPKKAGRGRLRKQQDVSEEDSAVLFEPAHKLEEIEHIMDDFADKLQSEAHDTLERKQAIPSSDDDIHQRKEQNLDGGNQPDKQQEELNCHEIEVKQRKSEVESQVRRPKEKPRKSTAIEVPLSSKDQLRSRIKHQSQNRT